MLRYAITDGRLRDLTGSQTDASAGALLPDPATSLVDRCAALASDGVDFVLVREKDLPAADQVALVRKIIAAVRQTGAATRVLVARRLDIALAVAAEGVHLSAGAGELTPAQVFQVFPEAFVSASCHTLEEVSAARAQGASAILFGPVFGKTVQGAEVAAGVGLARLEQAASLARPVPVFALGGVTLADGPACQAAGAAGVAAIRAFFGSRWLPQRRQEPAARCTF